MKIAISSLITRQTSPVTYGGTEAFVYDITENLVKRGHDITLYASTDSETSAKLKSFVSSQDARKELLGEKLSFPYYLLLSRNLALDANQFDIIHNNFFNTYLLAAFSPFIKIPLVHTIHNNYFHSEEWAHIHRVFLSFSNNHVVFLSNYTKKIAGNFNNSYVVYNGIDLNKFEYNEKPDDNLFWMSRMSEEKGAFEAVKTAIQTKKKLLMSMVIKNHFHKKYFNEKVKPILNKDISIQEGLNVVDRAKAYKNSYAFLFPIQWEEPFGLVMIEAMASGTPVIAFARGAIPEVIKDGETGFIVNSSDLDIRGDWIVKKTGVDGLCEAVERIYSMSEEEYKKMRRACRKHVESNFTIEKMVDGYERIYKEALEKNK